MWRHYFFSSLISRPKYYRCWMELRQLWQFHHENGAKTLSNFLFCYWYDTIKRLIMWNNTDKCKLSLPRILSAGEGSTNFISQTELCIYRTPMFVFTLSDSHFNLTLTEEYSFLGVTSIFKLPHLTSIWHLRGCWPWR